MLTTRYFWLTSIAGSLLLFATVSTWRDAPPNNGGGQVIFAFMAASILLLLAAIGIVVMAWYVSDEPSGDDGRDRR